MTMTIPFLSFFKKVKDQALARKERPAAAAKPVAPLEKPSSERFSKTVMPNATRTLPPQDPFEMAARSSAMGGQMPGPSGLLPPPSAPRTISFGARPRRRANAIYRRPSRWRSSREWNASSPSIWRMSRRKFPPITSSQSKASMGPAGFC